jgi:hypothetical protein
MYFKFLELTEAKLAALSTPPYEAKGSDWGSKTTNENVSEASSRVVFVVNEKTSLPSFMNCL